MWVGSSLSALANSLRVATASSALCTCPFRAPRSTSIRVSFRAIRLSSTFLRVAAALKAIPRCSPAGDGVVTRGELIHLWSKSFFRSFGHIGHLLISLCEFEHAPLITFVRRANFFGTAPRSFGALLPNRPVISSVRTALQHRYPPVHNY